MAHLSRLSLTDAEIEQFSPQLDKIVGYLDQLQEVDVSDVPEFTGPQAAESSLRDDDVGALLPVDEALSSVPVTHGRMVMVPKFKED